MGPTAIREAVILRRIDERQDRELFGDIGRPRLGRVHETLATRSVLLYSERLERGFRLLWPSLHAHLAKHPDGDSELVSRLLLVARLAG
jgi:hypothetical protein